MYSYILYYTAVLLIVFLRLVKEVAIHKYKNYATVGQTTQLCSRSYKQYSFYNFVGVYAPQVLIRNQHYCKCLKMAVFTMLNYRPQLTLQIHPKYIFEVSVGISRYTIILGGSFLANECILGCGPNALLKLSLQKSSNITLLG